MKLEQRQPTKPLSERTNDVIDVLPCLRCLRKFPETADELLAVAEAIATFCETVEVNHTNPEYPDPTLDLGWVRPIDWVCNQVLATFEFFPPPIKWRTIYDTKFVCLDGKTALELAAQAEG